MARRTYAQEHTAQIRDGEPSVAQLELHELDKAETQHKIMHPTTLDVTLKNGDVVKCKKKFGPADISKRNIMDELATLGKILIVETTSITGDTDMTREGWYEQNRTYMQIATDKWIVRKQTFKVIALLSGKTIAEEDISDTELQTAIYSLFALYLELSSEANSKAKN